MYAKVHAQVLPWCRRPRTRTLSLCQLIRRWRRPGAAETLAWRYPGATRELTWCSPGAALVLPRCPHVLPGCSHGAALLLPRCYPWCFAGASPATPCVLHAQVLPLCSARMRTRTLSMCQSAIACVWRGLCASRNCRVLGPAATMSATTLATTTVAATPCRLLRGTL